MAFPWDRENIIAHYLFIMINMLLRSDFQVKWTIDWQNKTISKASLPNSASLMEKLSDHRITQMTINLGTWGWCWLEGLAGFSSENKCCAAGEWTTLTLCERLCFVWGCCLPYGRPAVEDSADDFRWPQRSWYIHTSFCFFLMCVSLHKLFQILWTLLNHIIYSGINKDHSVN